MGNFSKDAGSDAKADKNLKTSGKSLIMLTRGYLVLRNAFDVVVELCRTAFARI
jgi:hypothetical protein